MLWLVWLSLALFLSVSSIYVVVATRVLWVQSARVVARDDEFERYVPVDGSHGTWRDVVERDSDGSSPPVFSVSEPELDDVEESARYDGIGAILGREGAGVREVA